MQQPVRILLADDHALFRRGLESLLNTQADIEVVGTAADGDEAVARAGELRPDVVLMDLQMPRSNGIQATRRMRQFLPEARVIILTVSERQENLMEALKAGADGYLLKDLEPEDLFQHLRAVLRGETPISGALASRILREHGFDPRQGLPLRRPPSDHPALTEREVEVLHLVSRGFTNGQISAELSISENTVKCHLKHILEKLRANNRAEATAAGLAEGWIRPHAAVENEES